MKFFGNPVPWQSQDRLGEEARRALRAAESMAADRGLRQTPPDLLLLALLVEPDGTVRRVFAALGVGVDGLCHDVEAELPGSLTALSEPSPLDAASREAVILAVNEARRGVAARAGAGHLLLGLLEERVGAGVRLLARQGIGVAELRPLIQQLDGSGDAAGDFSVAFTAFLSGLGGGCACPHCAAPLHASFHYCYACGADVSASTRR